MGSQTPWKFIVATAFVTAIATKVLDAAVKNYKINRALTQNDHIESIDENHEIDEELIREQLARNYAFLGEEGMERLKQQYVVVVGAGGVGSWVVTMLVRSGCYRIKVIDFDQVSLSSLNRHSCATLKDVGISKVQCLKEHMFKIAPWCKIEPVNELWDKDNAERLIFGEDGNEKPTFVIDCIDNINTKVDLLEFMYRNKIPSISSMGAATKSDPTRINVGDITMTEEDPLSRTVRRRLKQRGILTGITVVFSAEKPDHRKAKMLPLPEEEYRKGKVDELSALRDFRVRILPVLGTMPGVFGLTIASWVLVKMSGYPMDPIEGKNRVKVYDGIYHSLAAQMSRIGVREQRVPISLKDVAYVVEEVFRGKSPVSGFSTRLALSKWDPSKPLSLQNVVVLTKEEQWEHEDRVLNGGQRLEDVYSKEALDLIEKRFEEERYYAQYR